MVGALPTLLGAPEDRSLAMGLPTIAVALGVLLRRVDDRDRAYTVDLVCAGLLACPGLASHGWLRLRAFDASSWYFPEQRVLGILEQAGAGGTTAGILWGAAVALAALRGRRAVPLVAAFVTAGAWIGAGNLSVALLIDQLFTRPSAALTFVTALCAEWGVGAVLGATGAFVASQQVASARERMVSVGLGALLTGTCTVPVALLADTVDLAPFPGKLPAAPVGPRTIAPVYTSAAAPTEASVADVLVPAGHPEADIPWTPRVYRKSAWHRGLRMGLVVALPPGAPRSWLDTVAASAYRHNTFRIALPGRADGLPPGVMDDLLGWPTVDLLVDPPPASATWGTLHADGSLTWDDAPPTSDPPPHCALRADADTTVGTITAAAFGLADRTADHRCRGIAWPPVPCHPGGPGLPHCPAPPPDGAQ